MLDDLCKNVDATETYDVPNDSALIVDGQALVVALGNTKLQKL